MLLCFPSWVDVIWCFLKQVASRLSFAHCSACLCADSRREASEGGHRRGTETGAWQRRRRRLWIQERWCKRYWCWLHQLVCVCAHQSFWLMLITMTVLILFLTWSCKSAVEYRRVCVLLLQVWAAVNCCYSAHAHTHTRLWVAHLNSCCHVLYGWLSDWRPDWTRLTEHEHFRGKLCH